MLPSNRNGLHIIRNTLMAYAAEGCTCAIIATELAASYAPKSFTADFAW